MIEIYETVEGRPVRQPVQNSSFSVSQRLTQV